MRSLHNIICAVAVVFAALALGSCSGQLEQSSGGGIIGPILPPDGGGFAAKDASSYCGALDYLPDDVMVVVSANMADIFTSNIIQDMMLAPSNIPISKYAELSDSDKTEANTFIQKLKDFHAASGQAEPLLAGVTETDTESIYDGLREEVLKSITEKLTEFATSLAKNVPPVIRDKTECMVIAVRAEPVATTSVDLKADTATTTSSSGGTASIMAKALLGGTPEIMWMAKGAYTSADFSVVKGLVNHIFREEKITGADKMQCTKPRTLFASETPVKDDDTEVFSGVLDGKNMSLGKIGEGIIFMGGEVISDESLSIHKSVSTKTLKNSSGNLWKFYQTLPEGSISMAMISVDLKANLGIPADRYAKSIQPLIDLATIGSLKRAQVGYVMKTVGDKIGLTMQVNMSEDPTNVDFYSSILLNSRVGNSLNFMNLVGKLDFEIVFGSIQSEVENEMNRLAKDPSTHLSTPKRIMDVEMGINQAGTPPCAGAAELQ